VPEDNAVGSAAVVREEDEFENGVAEETGEELMLLIVTHYCYVQSISTLN
jgi:hypothetical protein